MHASRFERRARCAAAWRHPRGPILALSFLLAGCGFVYDRVGGAFRHAPEEMRDGLSSGARRLLDAALAGMDDEPLVDVHVHMISPFVAESWRTPWHPIRRVRLGVYLSASGVRWGDTLLLDYESRLVRLIESIPHPMRCFLYAMDHRYRSDGTPDIEETPLYVSNDLVMSTARRHPDLFIPVVSIHPYRPDALEELERRALEGCRHVKWLPNTMGIDLASPRLEPFYARMRDLGMVLLTHTGSERALEDEDPEFGNPLLLRRPLSMGLRVVALHAASEGTSADLDSPGRNPTPSFDLLLRLLDDPRYDGLLFCDTAALTFYTHLGRPLRTLLEREDLHRRLVHGSDYPLCAINMALRTSALRDAGFITDEEREQLNEIYDYNPLLCDLVVKRIVRHPVTGKRFPAAVFTLPAALQGAPRKGSAPAP